MADVVGARGTANVSQSIRRVDMVPTIFELEPNETPLTVFSALLPSEPTVNPEFSWQEDHLQPRFDSINNVGGYSNSATSIVVANGSSFAAQDVWKVTRTGEIMRITGVATNTLTAVRGIGTGGTGVAINNLDELMKIGSATPENALSKPARSNNPTKVTNYTQIVRTSIESSRTWRQSATFTQPKDWDRQVAHAMIEHKIEWEQIFLHGKPNEDLTGSMPLRTSGGALNYIQTNRTDMGGQMTEQEWFGGYSGAFRYGNKQAKTAFMSRLAVDVVNGFPRGKLEVIQNANDATYGLDIMKYRSPHGTINCITHNMLEGQIFGGYVIILDLSQIKVRPLGGDGSPATPHMLENIQPPDQDGRKDEILGEQGLVFGLEKTHALYTGITS